MKLKMQTDDYCLAITLTKTSRNYDKEQDLLKQLRDKQLDCLHQMLALSLDQVKLQYCIGNYEDCTVILLDMLQKMQKPEQDLHPYLWARYYLTYTKVLMSQNDLEAAKEKLSHAIKWFKSYNSLPPHSLAEELKELQVVLDIKLQEKVKQPFAGTLFKSSDEAQPTEEDISSDEDTCIIC